ncbi:hypothetical protein PAXRUDRAFT_820982 [Paxillus rubicundulus Ve08.2h10]|uniref:Uncharacterized protein n=1 Tax=Paxillus rubicundulus Ve08.2h10 TaxID=930991 RepID=A0A0D0DPJ1_9AGAM|nr:hypothetical protein PAXRUDRAFT_820982 [Paxillus rubicundulus Ve08.2h10]
MIRNSTVSKLRLPVEDTPDGEINSSEHEATELKTAAESFVILQSLKQSREKWLRTMFPKFSSRGRGGKQPDVVPPPHTIHNRGRCTLQIGPHAFIDTTVFEVHYHPVPVAVASSTTFVHQSTPAGHQTGSQPTTSSVSTAESSNPLLSSLASTMSVPLALISQVNAAATSNPTLANLLQLAASGRALPDQLKTLGLLIQSLASSPAMDILPAPSQTSIATTDSKSTLVPTVPTVASHYQYQTPVKDFDIVLEFREALSERWIFPRGPATCEFTPASGNTASIGDITLSTIVPFAIVTPSSGPETSPTMDITPKQVVVFQFKMASLFIWDSFSRWTGPKERMEQNRGILSEIEPLERKYLAYRLPEGSQLTQIQNAAVPSFSMKSIKPTTENGKPKRRLTSRKLAQDGDPPGSQTTKRKRQAQPKSQVAPPKIACFACGQTEVPLIMGGRYCRPCVEAGRGREVPQLGGGTLSYRLPAQENVQNSSGSTINSPQCTSQPSIPEKDSGSVQNSGMSHSEQGK